MIGLQTHARKLPELAKRDGFALVPTHEPATGAPIDPRIIEELSTNPAGRSAK